MSRSAVLRKVIAPLAAIAVVAGAAVAGSAPASAAQIGTLSFTNLVDQTNGWSWTTSGGCPNTATNYITSVTGGTLPNPPLSYLNGNSSGSTVSGGINNGGFTVVAGQTLVNLAAASGVGTSLPNGTYTVTVTCRTAFQAASLGDFLGQFSVNGNVVTPVVASVAVDTTTTVTPSSATPAWGAPVSLAVTVAPVTGSTVPTGSVQLKDGGVDISGATGTLSGGSVTIPVTNLALGAHTITAAYTSNDAAKFNNSTSTSSSVTVSLQAPTVVRAASLSGSAVVGGVLTCNTGSWSGATSYTYEFLKNGAVVQAAGATFTRTLVAADVNALYTCRVTGINPIGAGTPSTSAAVKVGLGAAPVARTRAKISYSGKPIVGRTFVAYRGGWSPVATYKYTYTWKRGTTVVSHSTTYKAKLADKGKYLTLVVTAIRVGYKTGTSTSLPVRIG